MKSRLLRTLPSRRRAARAAAARAASARRAASPRGRSRCERVERGALPAVSERYFGSEPSITSHGASPVLVSRSASSRHVDELVVLLEVLPVAGVDAPARLLARRASSLRRFFCAFFERWNQSFTMSAPSSTSMRSKWRMRSIGARARARFSCARHALDDRVGVPGAEEDADAPLGRQRPPEAPHRAGARAPRPSWPRRRGVRTWRGSIHSLRRLTVSPLPAPSTPFTRMMTGKLAVRRAGRTARASSSWRSFGSSRLYSDFRELVADFGGFEHRGFSPGPGLLWFKVPSTAPVVQREAGAGPSSRLPVARQSAGGQANR